MSLKDNFYLSLLSNASFDEYPENKTSSFTVNLPQQIGLEGDWMVAVSEVLYQHTIENVTKNNNALVLHYDQHENIGPQLINTTKVVKRFEIPVGLYANIEDVITAMNKVIMGKYRHPTPFVKISKTTDRVELCAACVENISGCFFAHHIPSLTKDWRSNDLLSVVELPIRRKEHVGEKEKQLLKSTVTFKKLILEGHLAHQLGFEYDKCILTNKPKHQPNIRLGTPPEMLIYCNIIEPQLFADTHAQVLRTMPAIDNTSLFGDVLSRTFAVRNYLPVMTKSFKTIDIAVRTATGTLMPFLWGTFQVLLHFKKNKDIKKHFNMYSNDI